MARIDISTVVNVRYVEVIYECSRLLIRTIDVSLLISLAKSLLSSTKADEVITESGSRRREIDIRADFTHW